METGTVICAEHGTKLDDPDLIAAIIEASKESPCGVDPIADWDALPREEQIMLQLSWVAPPYTEVVKDDDTYKYVRV